MKHLEAFEPTVQDTFDHEAAAAHRRNGYWLDGSLSGYLDHWACEKPDDTVIIDGDVFVTWRDLRDNAYRTAASLLDLGIERGDRVVVQLPNWQEFVVVYFAVARIGAVIVPALPIYRHHELRHMITLTDAKAYVLTPSFRGFDYLSMARDLRKLPSLSHLVVVRRGDTSLMNDELPLEWLMDGRNVPSPEDLGPPPHADDNHIIGFTSGTEAGAKGCLHTWNTYSHSPRTQANLYHFGPDDCELVPSPVTHTGGLAGGLLKATLTGGCACFMDIWDAATAIELIDRHSCTQATGATAFISSLVEAYDPATHSAASLQHFICGGAPVPDELVRRTRQTLPNCQILNCFGQTEGLSISSCTAEDPEAKIVGSDGRPVPGVEVEIRLEDGTAVRVGEVGHIVYRGPATMLGYWRNREATEAIKTADGWRRTGDLGFFDADGYLRITGRAKEMIIRGGMNISTRELEELLRQHPKVSDVAVVGLPDPTLGERACAFVVAAGDPPTLPELIQYLLDEHQLAKPKLPERLELIKALPLSATGKVQKMALYELVAVD
jgi:non-ribosomal peptide synthetase component E (peptide arylation enzyme)